MKRILFTIILSLLPVLCLTAQNVYAPKAGEVQASLIIGSSTFFNQDGFSGYDYLLPADDGSSIGFGDGNQSADPALFLNLGDMNGNSIVNMVGIRFGVFVSDHFEVNALFGMNINITPKKDFLEGDFSVPDMAIPDQQYIVGKTNHLFHIELGSNYYFLTKKNRVQPYLGIVAGFQMARVEAVYPYTGETNTGGDPIELTRGSYRAGQAWAIQGGIMAGVDYMVSEGLAIGFEVSPALYQYSMMELHPAGMEVYRAAHHNIKLLTMPRLKLAVRF